MGLGEGGRKRTSTVWHLVGSPSHKNLAGCVSVVLAQHLAQLRRAEAAAVRSEQVEQPPSQLRPPAQRRAIAQAQLARQAERMARYEHILDLQKRGLTSAEMALQLGVTQRTMRAVARDRNHPLLWPPQTSSASG